MPEPTDKTDSAILSKGAAAAAQWRKIRYRHWQEEQQHAEPGLRPTLLRLALASSLMQPPFIADGCVCRGLLCNAG